MTQTVDHRHLETEIEYLKQNIQELKDTNQRNSDEYAKKLADLEDKLDIAISQLDMYRHFTIFIRAVFIGFIMIVGIRYAEIKDFFFGGSTG